MHQKSRQRKWFVVMLVLIPLLSAILIVGAAELISQSLEPKAEGGVSNFEDPKLGRLPKPGEYKVASSEYNTNVLINALHINDREVTQSDLQNDNRILALGDSHTFAVGVSTYEMKVGQSDWKPACFQTVKVELSGTVLWLVTRSVNILNDFEA
jgi:hypothetical protein